MLKEKLILKKGVLDFEFKVQRQLEPQKLAFRIQYGEFRSSC